MSFDVNVLSSKPVIKAAANMQNDGGSGGNLGYMKRRKEKKKNEEYSSLFCRQNKNDFSCFQREINLPNAETFSFAKFVEHFYNAILKIFHKYTEK